MKVEHYLKCWPNYYHRVIIGKKNFEVRKNDRDFQTGDLLILQEWNPETETFTGNEKTFWIDYILHGPAFGIEEGYCVMSIKPV